MYSQQTVGVFTNHESALESYTLFSPFKGTNSYMIDNCGRVINVWDRTEPVGLAAYFLKNGQLLRTIQVDVVLGPFYSQSNSGATELVDWDNNTVWRYNLNTDTTLSHHDVKYMANGNVLILGWETMDQNDLFVFGRNPNFIRTGNHNFEYIIEVEPQGSSGGEILWEWHLKDHLIQEINENQNNFGIVADHPELMDINYLFEDFDWTHINAVDYNEALDQILLSVRNLSEIWILDHSTTNEEASTHSGGRYGKGGDILYRWGNSQAYDRGSGEDRKLYNQHGVNWIEPGLLDEGKIVIFNNGFGRGYSSVEIIETPITDNGSYELSSSEAYGPNTIYNSYGENVSGFYSHFLSNAHRLPNGHMVVNEGGDGRIFELDENNTIVWEYKSPVIRDFISSQGSAANGPLIFRAYKYAKNYAGFDDLAIEPGELLEGDSEYNLCSTVTHSEVIKDLNLTFNQHLNTLRIYNPNYHLIEGNIYSINGHLIQIFSTNNLYDELIINMSSPSVLYISYKVNSLLNGSIKIFHPGN